MKSKGILIALGVLVFLGGGYFFMSARNKSVTDDSMTGESVGTMGGGSTTLMDLLAKGVSQKCTYNDITDEYDVSGTTYISGGKVRGDFTTTYGGQTQTGHTIYDGKVSYVWMEGQPNGFMIEADQAMESEDTTGETQQVMDLNKTIDYRCAVWVPDNSVFTPPSDVNFMEFAVPTLSQGGAMEGSENLCDSCSALSGDQKTQCLQALNCN